MYLTFMVTNQLLISVPFSVAPGGMSSPAMVSCVYRAGQICNGHVILKTSNNKVLQCIKVTKAM